MMQGRLAAWLVRLTPPPLSIGIAVATGFIVVETLLLYPFRQVAPLEALAVVYLLGVLVVSTVWGLWLGVATSIVSALAFDYFHTPPVGHFAKEDWRDWLGLSVYLMVAGIASSVAQLARTRALEAVERRRETDAVAELTRLILGAEDVRTVLPEASDQLARAMQVPYAAIELSEVPPPHEGRIQLPLEPGALVVPADLPDRVMRRLRDGVVPGLATVLRAGIALQAGRTEVEVLLTQQAVLRRVAVLVAHGVAPTELVAAVAAETAELFNADATRVTRREGPSTVTVVAEYSKSEAEPMLGKRLDPSGGVTGLVLRDSRPARMDSYDGSSGPLTDLAHAESLHAYAGAPIVVDGRVWGVLVAQWGPTSPPPPGIEHELAQFTELVATAIANTESRAELNASRARLVFAADEARRGIERELHDSVQQRLISLKLEIRAAEALVPQELGELRSRLSDIAAGLSGAFEDLQQIVRGIHPAILSQGGLGSAIKALARRCPVPVAVRTGPKRRLPGYVEVAAYYVVSEALANSAEHANVSAIDVDLDIVADGSAVDGSAQGEVLSVTVHHNGVGAADPRQSFGLAGVRDRVEALGGTLTLTSSAGRGTSLSVKLPVGGQDQQGPEAGWPFGGT